MLTRGLLEDAAARITRQYLDSGEPVQRIFQMRRPNLADEQPIPYGQRNGERQLARDIGMESATRADLSDLENFTIRYAVVLRVQEANRLDLEGDYRRAESNPLHGWYEPLLGFGFLGLIGGAFAGRPIEGGLVGITAGLVKDLWNIRKHRSLKQRLTIPLADAMTALVQKQEGYLGEIIDDTLTEQRDATAYLLDPVSISAPSVVSPAPG